MTDPNAIKVLYKIPIAIPAVEFRARVARIGGGDTALMDEVILRLLWSTSSLTIGTVRELFGLSTDQLDAFLSPLTAAGRVAVSEFGGLSLTEAGLKLFDGQKGIPRLREIRFHTESIRIDQISLQPCAWSSSARAFRPFVIECDRAPDLTSLKDRVQQVLENEYDDYMVLRSRGAAESPESVRLRPRISFVDEINDGYSLPHEMNATIALDNRGEASVTFEGLPLEGQNKAREVLLKRITDLLRFEAASADRTVTRDSLVHQLSLGLPSCPDLIAPGAVIRYLADGGVDGGENYFWCLGRPELTAKTQITAQLERVLKRLPLKRGEESRSAAWLVSIVANSTFWGRGDVFQDHHARLLRRVRDEDPQCRSLLIMIGKEASEQLEYDDDLAGAFDVTVCVPRDVPQYNGIDALLLPNELVQATHTAFLGRQDGFPIPYCVASSREDWAVEATGKLIRPVLAQRELVVKGSSENEIRDVIKSFLHEPNPEPGARPRLTLGRKK